MLNMRVSRITALRFVLIVLIAVVPVVCVLWITHAANRFWTGNGLNNRWNTDANWKGNVGPSAGDDLVFGSSNQANSDNNFAIGTTFNSISVSDGHSMTGNSVSLDSGITADNGTIDLSSITLNDNQTFNAPAAGNGALIKSAIDNNGKTLTLTGPGNFTITGNIGGTTGGLIKSGTGRTQLFGANSYTGITSVNEGTLLVFGDQHTSNVQLSGGATLGGTGTVGRIAFSGVQGGSISPALVGGAGILTANGNVSFPSAGLGFFEVDLNGAPVGGYDQLKIINGTVSLGLGANSALNIHLHFVPQPGATFTIIDNDGTDAVSETFGGKPEGSTFTLNGTTIFITYRGGDGNDVVLHVPTTRTWDGRKDDGTPSADSKWSTKENWVGDVAPQLGDDLVFPAGAARPANNNDFADGTPFSSITMSGNGYTLDGAAIGLSGNFTNNPTSADTNTINLTILSAAALTSAQNFLSGIQSQLILNANNTYAGVTSITGGGLTVNGNQPNSPINVIGGDLRGVGTVGHITATSGRIEPSISSVPADITLTVNGIDCSGASFNPSFFGSPGPVQNSQLDVVGAVNLNQCGMGFKFVNPIPIPAGTNLTIIKNDLADAINGTFTDKPEGSVFSLFVSLVGITYVGGDGNDVVLHVPATRTWDGGGITNNWKEAANWEGDAAPGPGDDLIFPAGKPQMSNNNDFPAGTTFNSISFSGAPYTLSGNSIALINGISDSVSSPANAIELSSIKLLASQTFTKPGTSLAIRSDIDTNGKILTVDGAGQKVLRGNIGGIGGSLVINGTGLVQTAVSGTNSFSGPTIINSGSFFPSCNHPNSAVQLNSGELVGGSIPGTFKSLNASGGIVHIFDQGQLIFNENLTMTSSVTYRPRLINSIGKLTVAGSVNLGNSILDVEHLGFPPAPGQIFTIVNKTSAGAIQATFNNLPERAGLLIGGVTFTISYVGGDGNDVTLTVPTTRRWDGGGANSNWQTKENWENDVAPLPGDDLVFPAGASRMFNNNDFPANTTFNKISILDGFYTLNGNAVRLNDGLVNNNGSANLTVNTVNLVLTGPGGLTNSSSNANSRLILTGANDYLGTTTINNGVLVVNGGVQAFSPVVMNDGTLEGIGMVGPVTARDGTVRPGTLIQGNSTGALSVIGGVAFAPAAQFSPTIGILNNNLQNTVLNVAGGVSLNNCRFLLFLNSNAIPLLSPGMSFTIINNDGADPVSGTFNGFPEGAALSLGGRPFKVTYVGGDGNDVVLVADNLTIQFNSSLFTVGEGDQRVNLTLTRSGDTSAPASVGITTSDAAGSQSCGVFNGNASARCDYTIMFGIVEFAAGEASKIFSIPIVDDSYAEGNENFTVTLNNPSGAFVGTQSTTTVTIVDNETTTGPNPVDTTDFFVRQHYLDFFSREPDPGGFNFWVGTITSCAADPQCVVEVKRINASAAFYLSIEFRGTGYLVERIYKVAYGDATGSSTFPSAHQLAVPIIRFNEFLPDTQQIGRGVIVNQTGWETVLENNKQAFTAAFVQRARFLIAFPASMTAAQLVDKLNQNAGNPLSQVERDQLINDLTSGAKTRAQVLRAVAEDPDLSTAEFNRAFVLMQYFGYLRRNPDDPQDTDYTGYDFWLTKLNQFNGNFNDAEMVKAFITSIEYRKRFGP